MIFGIILLKILTCAKILNDSVTSVLQCFVNYKLYFLFNWVYNARKWSTLVKYIAVLAYLFSNSNVRQSLITRPLTVLRLRQHWSILLIEPYQYYVTLSGLYCINCMAHGHVHRTPHTLHCSRFIVNQVSRTFIKRLSAKPRVPLALSLSRVISVEW